MQGQNEERSERVYHPMEAANPAYAFPKDTGYAGSRLSRDETPDHLRVGNMVNLLATDMRQLLEEINELRARLSPILSEQKQPPMGNPPIAPAHCKMAAELGEVLATLQQARLLVSVTLSQLDL